MYSKTWYMHTKVWYMYTKPWNIKYVTVQQTFYRDVANVVWWGRKKQKST